MSQTYEAYLQKAKGLKEEFKARDSMGNGGSSAGSVRIYLGGDG